VDVDPVGGRVVLDGVAAGLRMLPLVPPLVVFREVPTGRAVVPVGGPERPRDGDGVTVGPEAAVGLDVVVAEGSGVALPVGQGGAAGGSRACGVGRSGSWTSTTIAATNVIARSAAAATSRWPDR
jgi:hypothetical protein